MRGNIDYFSKSPAEPHKNTASTSGFLLLSKPRQQNILYKFCLVDFQIISSEVIIQDSESSFIILVPFFHIRENVCYNV